MNKKAYVHIEDWQKRLLQGGCYPYVYVDGIYLRRNRGGAEVVLQASSYQSLFILYLDNVVDFSIAGI